ncbi:hypothetical protein KDA_56960 [Dictyobacter alpinus]|uniref:Uncharacterized protein n=1 Tax=Dictyobacter alpinus TaxID=2014873 RepID=A0A402BG22_9CHLR|nr:hypothetical protein [Dictyobacter alpinus]GCE30212.1 hypothetical protein KDA_56960 [Dictyobacter alpinus]
MNTQTRPEGQTVPYTNTLAEQWLIERTYHAKLSDGTELSVPHLTEAFRNITSTYIPISAWKELSRQEARQHYEQGNPLLLYSEHTWNHAYGNNTMWSSNKNMRAIIYSSTPQLPDEASGISYGLYYLDSIHGNFANSSWEAWFSSTIENIFAENSHTTFLKPFIQFPASLHYTIIAADGHVEEYASADEAVQGFQTMPALQQDGKVSLPEFCYYCEVTTSSGRYRIEFFGPRMNEPGYPVKVMK